MYIFFIYLYTYMFTYIHACLQYHIYIPARKAYMISRRIYKQRHSKDANFRFPYISRGVEQFLYRDGDLQHPQNDPNYTLYRFRPLPLFVMLLTDTNHPKKNSILCPDWDHTQMFPSMPCSMSQLFFLKYCCWMDKIINVGLFLGLSSCCHKQNLISSVIICRI